MYVYEKYIFFGRRNKNEKKIDTSVVEFIKERRGNLLNSFLLKFFDFRIAS